MTVVGIAYLLVVGISLGVLSGRDRRFHREAPTTQGTVVEVTRPAGTTLGRTTGQNRSYRIVTIKYSINGRTGTTVADVPTRVGLTVGSTVTLVYRLGENSDDDFVLMRDLGVKPLAAMSVFFIFAAGLVATISVIRLVQGRRLRQPPREKLREIPAVAVAATAIDHQHGQARLERDPAQSVDE